MSDSNLPTFLGVQQVARLCKVAPRTVHKWFDSGRLTGYRDDRLYRRISVQSLRQFLTDYGFPPLDDEQLIELSTRTKKEEQ